MKKIIVIILATLFLISASPKALTFWLWKINQAKIAATLCINKDVKGSTCNGKCYLKKEIDSQEGKQGPILPIELKSPQFPLYCTTPVFYNSEKIKNTNHVIVGCNPLFKNRLILNKLLRPPQKIFIS